MKTILFQGDSITDVGRVRDIANHMGGGYPLLVKGMMGYENPGKYVFWNRGISGNRVVDVYARIKLDIINLKPDVMSILIGVNDVWHDISRENGVDAEKYFKIYSMLIEEIKVALPNVQIMILEPFVLKGSATEETWDIFRTEVEKRAQKARMVAEKFGLTFIPLQEIFDKAAELAAPEVWTWDGVHPTTEGHELIKREWLKGFKKL